MLMVRRPPGITSLLNRIEPRGNAGLEGDPNSSRQKTTGFGRHADCRSAGAGIQALFLSRCRIGEHHEQRCQSDLTKHAPYSTSMVLARSEEHTSELQSRVDLVCR